MPAANRQKNFRKKLARLGLDIGEDHFYTSALATAKFLQSQAPGCSAYVIGDHGLFNALYDAGITINDVDPEYVVVGETTGYGYEHICKAMNLVNRGSRLIATNTDITGPVEGGIAPACRAFVAPIEATTGKKAYYVNILRRSQLHTGNRNDAIPFGMGEESGTILAGIVVGQRNEIKSLKRRHTGNIRWSHIIVGTG